MDHDKPLSESGGTTAATAFENQSNPEAASAVTTTKGLGATASSITEKDFLAPVEGSQTARGSRPGEETKISSGHVSPPSPSATAQRYPSISRRRQSEIDWIVPSLGNGGRKEPVVRYLSLYLQTF